MLPLELGATFLRRRLSMAGHVFISHSSEDALIAAAIEKALRAYGVPAWVDMQ